MPKSNRFGPKGKSFRSTIRHNTDKTSTARGLLKTHMEISIPYMVGRLITSSRNQKEEATGSATCNRSNGKIIATKETQSRRRHKAK